MSADPAASALDEIRERADAVNKAVAQLADAAIEASATQVPEVAARPAILARLASSFDVPRLLKAVEAALRHHEPMPTYAPAEHADGSPACGHDTDRASHFEGDTGEMLCGESPGPPVCAWCEDNLLDPGEAEWPCPAYADITAALAGGDGDDR